jgi:hypothetical protein
MIPRLLLMIDDMKKSPVMKFCFLLWYQNLPDRPKPIKEDTVIEYISECVKAGYEVDWERFCHDADFTVKKALEVEAAVLRAGSTEFLKPIKEQSAEFVRLCHSDSTILPLVEQKLSFCSLTTVTMCSCCTEVFSL